MKRFIVLLLVVVLVTSLIVTGCRPKPPERPDYPDEMPCGMIVDLSGPYSEMGLRLSTGAEVAVEQMNDWGGIRNMYSMQLDLIVADDGGSAAQAAAEAERLITEEEVIFLIGAWPTATAIAEVAEQYEVPFICPLDMEPITDQGLAYTFRTTAGAEAAAAQIVAGMTESAAEAGLPAPESCFVMYVPDDQGNAVVGAFKEQAEASGIDIVGEETIDPAAASFAAQLAAAEAASPDLLFTCNYTGDAIVLYQEMMARESYFPYGVYSWGWGTADPVFYESLPLEAYEYGFVYEAADPVAQDRSYYEWIDDGVRARIDEDWNTPEIATAYHAVWLVKEALERMVELGASLPGQSVEIEFSLELDKFRNNLRLALTKLDLSRALVEKVQLPDGSPFLPALHVLRFEQFAFDENGQSKYATGIISQNVDGTRWPLYPTGKRVSDSPSVVLPIPPWSER
ncbi:MAG: ABC transporter substrate-binding protein [Dehalococcoidales bacterium]|nr:ABC transporter substrate-binding protein [Dehalococcoidales bacterium]